VPELRHDRPQQLQREVRVTGNHANTFSFFWNGAEKVRNARDASDLRPLETTWRQLGVTREDWAPAGGRPACRRRTSGPTATSSATGSWSKRRTRTWEQLRADVPRGRRARRAAGLRDFEQRLGPIVPGTGVRAADRQHRHPGQLLHPGLVGRRPRLKFASSTATTSPTVR